MHTRRQIGDSQQTLCTTSTAGATIERTHASKAHAESIRHLSTWRLESQSFASTTYRPLVYRETLLSLGLKTRAWIPSLGSPNRDLSAHQGTDIEALSVIGMSNPRRVATANRQACHVNKKGGSPPVTSHPRVIAVTGPRISAFFPGASDARGDIEHGGCMIQVIDLTIFRTSECSRFYIWFGPLHLITSN